MVPISITKETGQKNLNTSSGIGRLVGRNLVVPLTMEFVPFDYQCCKLLFEYFDTSFIRISIKLGVNS